MFKTKASAVMSAKRLKRQFGVTQARGQELVARAAGYHDWHHLETIIGTSSAPKCETIPKTWPDAMSDFARRHGLLLDADHYDVLNIIVPDATLASTESNQESSTNGATNMIVNITETAAIILDALHAGCTVTTTDAKGAAMATAIIEPYIVAPIQSWADENWKLSRVDRQRDRYSTRLIITEDAEKKARIDIWKGADTDVEASLRDLAMLVRGELATMGAGGKVSIAQAGREIAQARIGNGVEIVDHVAKPITAAPTNNFRIGKPSFFNEMQEAQGIPELVLYSYQGKPAFKAGTDEHTAYSWVDPAVARTIASMMADAGKVDRDTSAAFGPVRVTLHQRGDVTFAFGDHLAIAEARISKVQAKMAKAYLVELAKGAETQATIDPAEVQMKIRYLVQPETLGSWDDIQLDDEEDADAHEYA